MKFLRTAWIGSIGLFFLIFDASSQTNLDSLKVIWQNNTHSNGERMEAFEKFIWSGYLFSQPDSAYYFCQLKLDKAREWEMEDAIADALRMQGMSWVFRGEHEKAISVYVESHEYYEKINDLVGMGRIKSNLGVVYTDLSKHDKALEALNRSFELFQKAEAHELIGLPLVNMGRVYYKQGDFDDAIEKYLVALSFFEDVNDRQNIGGVYGNLAAVHEAKSEYRLAIQYYEKSLRISEELSNLVGLCTLHTSIYSLYRKLNDYTKALKHLEAGLDLAHAVNSKSFIAEYMRCFGQSLDDRGKSIEAIPYFKKSIELFKETQNMQILALALSELGATYLKLSHMDSASHYLFQGYYLADEINDRWTLSIASGNIAEMLRLQGSLRESIHYGHIGIGLAKETEVHVNIGATAETLYKSYKEIGNEKKALEMLEMHLLYRDSIRSEENIKELARFEFKYEYEKKALADSLRTLAENEAIAYNHQVEVAQKETERNLYASAGLILLFASFLFYQRKANKNKLKLKENEAAYQQELIYASINSQENERRRIARDLHDEVGAMLSTLKLQLGAVGKKLSVSGDGEDPTKPAVSLVDETITNVRRISKDLLPPTLEEFGLAHALEDLADKVSAASGVIIKKDIQPLQVRLEVERELALYRVIQEMMNNALKHSEATEFNLAMSEKDGRLHLSFSDNGKGFDLAAIKKSKAGKTGLGLKNLENRVGAAGGEMEYESRVGKGTGIEIRVSLSDHVRKAA